MTDKRLSLIVAMTPQRVIGRDNGLPWHLSADLKHFKAITLGKPIVMGRKTFESIGRPLPGRQNIVITRSDNYVADGITVVHSLDDALTAAADAAEIMIIGGAQLYQAALVRAQRLYLTHVDADIEGDTYFPAVEWEQWRIIERSASQSADGIGFFFAVYDRR